MTVTGSIKDVLTINRHIASTRSADLYNVSLTNAEDSKLLWTLRYPLANSQHALSRLKKIYSLELPNLAIESYGVDEQHTLYSILPFADIKPVLGKVDAREAERRFLSCVRFIARLHSEQICCGDISASSFCINRNGEVCFIGIMGAHDGFTSGTAALPPLETFKYMAPEQRTGAEASFEVDVFALGVLGYELFTNRSPFNETESAVKLPTPTAPSQVVKGLPEWVDTTLLKALSVSTEERFSSAVELLKGIESSKNTSLRQSDLPTKKPQPAERKVETGPSFGSRQSDEDSEDQQTGGSAVGALNFSNKTLAVLAAVFFVTVTSLLTFIFQRTMRGEAAPVEEETSVNTLLQHRDATADLRMKLAIDSLSENSQTLEDKLSAIRGLSSSDDTLTHEVLLTSSLSATLPEQRAISEQVIVERVRRLLFARTAEQLHLWFRTLSFPTLPERYESIIRAANPFLSADEVAPLLKNVYAAEPGLALRLTVARALDSGKPEAYEPLLRDFLGDQRRLGGPAFGNWATLVLEEPDLATLYGEDALRFLSTSAPEALMHLLKVLAERNDSLMQPVAGALVNDKTLQPHQKSIAKILAQRGDLPGALQAVLARILLAVTTPQDIITFSQWVDGDSEKVLFSLAAMSEASPFGTEALELLAGRSLQDRQMAAVFERVRSAFWDKRDTLARAIGILGLRQEMDLGSIEQAVKSFKSVTDDRKTVNALLTLGDERVLSAVLKVYGDKVGIGSLLKLLEDKDPKIRIAAIRSLKAFNDVGALKLILEYYDREKHDDVRKAYRDTFWTLADKK